MSNVKRFAVIALIILGSIALGILINVGWNHMERRSYPQNFCETVQEYAEKYDIPEGTQTGTRFTLRGKGIADVNTKRRGDMILTVVVETPKNLTSAQKKLLTEFSKSLGEDNSGKKENFFKKLFNK